MTKKTNPVYAKKTYVIESCFCFFVDVKHAGVIKGKLPRNAA
jgi:hypothetical protein